MRFLLALVLLVGCGKDLREVPDAHAPTPEPFDNSGLQKIIVGGKWDIFSITCPNETTTTKFYFNQTKDGYVLHSDKAIKFNFSWVEKDAMIMCINGECTDKIMIKYDKSRDILLLDNGKCPIEMKRYDICGYEARKSGTCLSEYPRPALTEVPSETPRVQETPTENPEEIERVFL